MIRACILSGLLAAVLGCTVRMERLGTEHLLDPGFAWTVGQTTASDIARDLGPPNEIQSIGDDLRFIYQFQRSFETSFIVSYVIKLFTRNSRASEARRLIVSFDRSNRLLGHLLLAPFGVGTRADPGGEIPSGPPRR